MRPTYSTLSAVPAVVLISFILLVASGSTCLVHAQTDYSSNARVRHETKKGVRQAKKIKTDYSETHLATDAHMFRAGEHGRRFFSPRDGYEFDESGYPVIENKARKKGFFRRKKSK
jgi:hypothetical protein